MPDPVTIQFLKKPDVIHWGFEAVVLGNDEYGIWLAIPAGGRRWKGEVDRSPVEHAAAFLAPHDDWWTLHYAGPETQYVLFVDITTPPVWVSGERVEMVDLDLDVGLTQDGRAIVEDEDEFIVHQLEYGYTEREIRSALEATERVVRSLETRHEPFFEVARTWWEAALEV